jgi:hypothetical protein
MNIAFSINACSIANSPRILRMIQAIQKEDARKKVKESK